MNWFQKLPGHRRSPPGLERSILHELPKALAAGTLIPAFVYLFARYFPSPADGQTVERYLTDIGILAISVVATVWTAVLTIAIGCFVVIVMKGPAYVADRYQLQDADEPAQESNKDDNDR
jgi:hypothetical protein